MYFENLYYRHTKYLSTTLLMAMLYWGNKIWNESARQTAAGKSAKKEESFSEWNSVRKDLLYTKSLNINYWTSGLKQLVREDQYWIILKFYRKNVLRIRQVASYPIIYSCCSRLLVTNKQWFFIGQTSGNSQEWTTKIN